MSRYKAYPDYKDAESKWMDVLPMEWKRAPLKYLVAIRITDGPHETPEFVDEGVPFLSAEAVKENKLDFSKKRGFITRALHEIYSKKCLPKIDDVFMIKSGNTTGNIAIVETTEEFNIWSPLALIRSDKYKVLPRYVFYSMCADYFRTSVELSWSQGTQPNIGMGVIENLHIPVGSIKEQQTIANFLDHETAKIDTLIAKQQELIKLLKEKRQAVISHAVTKGLNPNAPMRDSGVEWLGEVPADWVGSNLGFECVVKARLGWKGLKAEEYVDDGYIFLATPNIKGDRIEFENVNYITKERYDESPEIMLEIGDVLVTKDGSTTGTTNIVRELPKPATINSSIALMRSNGRLNPSYLYYFFVSTYIQNVIKMMQGGMGVPHLFQADLRKFFMVVPSSADQKLIVEHIEKNIPKLDRLVELAQNEVGLLIERRTALISAAVTGKIDVRDWQPPSDAAIAA